MMIFSVGVLLLPLVCSQPEGWISSPDYPLAYPSNRGKNWTLCASSGFAVSLTLIHLDLKNSTDCKHDALKIYNDNNLIKSLCGNMSLMEMPSSNYLQFHSAPGGCLNIYFHSDDSHPQVHTGFNAFYQKQVDVDECTNQTNPCNQICYNFIGGFRCSCRHGYLLSHDKVTCKAIECRDPKPLQNGHFKYVKGSKNDYLSVIEYDCNKPYYTAKGKHGNYTCSAAQIWKENGNNILPSCHYVCGQHKLSSQFGRIFGGKTAPLGSFPWQIYLKITSNTAGASIIGDKWLMTAAHNLVQDTTPIQKEIIKAYAGHNDINEMKKFITLNISSIHIHENYTADYDNDIALIKLKSPITFSENIRPVCLPPKHTEENTNRGLVSGFGLTEKYSLPEKLMYVDIYTVDQHTCRASFEEERKNNNIPSVTDNMFCAGVIGGGKDSCAGDSGSAFVVLEKGVYCAAGIVSWGMRICGTAGKYGVYTQVSHYLDWINKTMSEN